MHFVLHWWKYSLGFDINFKNFAKVIPYTLKVVHFSPLP